MSIISYRNQSNPALTKCPCCRSKDYFLPCGMDLPLFRERKVIGGGYRENCLCPKCGSIDRYRLLYLYLSQVVVSPESKVLHVAPEWQLRNLFENANYYNSIMDIRSLQFPDNYFDLVICCHVLEHVDKDKQAMNELFRVLAPDGIAILQVPICLEQQTIEGDGFESDEEREQKFGQKDHLRLYGNDYVSRLQNSGFCVEIFEWWKERPEWAEYGLNPEEGLYVGY